MTKEQLSKILEDIRSVKIIVIGDFCLDAYWFVDESSSEISIETGLPTRPVRRQAYSPGGAGNVAANLSALRTGSILAFGVIGEDPFGSGMIRILNELGIDTRNLLVQERNWDTQMFAKPHLEGKEINRFDWGNFNSLSKSSADLLINNLKAEIPSADLVIINQQVPSGIHTSYFRKELLNLVKRFPSKKFITDSRSFNDFYEGTIRKMNDIEAARLCGSERDSQELTEITVYANLLYKRFAQPLFITRGSRGSIVADINGVSEIPGLLILSRVDTVGAGDSYLAGAAATLAAGYDMKSASEVGSYVAGVTVQKLYQTGTASPEEVLAIGTDPDFIYNPGLACDAGKAKYHEGSEIEIINKLPDKFKIRHAIFDHDGTISTLREGWEIIMAPVMIRAILGGKTVDEQIYNLVQSRVREFIDKTTGLQTLAQMKGLVEMVKEAGFVPAGQILDEHGYKKIYNDELIRLVSAREEKFRGGGLSVDDLTIRNVVPFLQKLHEAGIRLYLASGTDVEDVRNEAVVLGYDHLFGDRIFGAVGDLKKEAKKIVLDRILGSISDDSPGQIVTFGDGPVEMRETKKQNGIAVGVASNEISRFGLNETKRCRLIMAGADIVVPDFSEYTELMKLLNIY